MTKPDTVRRRSVRSGGLISRQRTTPSFLNAAVAGALAGAAGTAALDLIEFTNYRTGGGTQPVIDWETAAGVDTWGEASAPGQVGKGLVEKLSGRKLGDRWARTVTNTVHWVTGIGWGAQYGVANRLWPRHRAALFVVFGPAVWLVSYAVLPFAKVYKPIWQYDTATLAKDLGAHLAYGSVTAATFAAISRPTRAQ
jgi:hypothetical protein